ncbi:MAG: c-type cytochrome [Planctomycetes bacterium]|nr:c-type cytochrome [Planctomycetota bacterium]
MADNIPAASSEVEEQDPVVTKSILWPVFLAMIALSASAVWSVWDEFYTRRPYKDYQNEWVESAKKAYAGKRDASAAEWARVTASDEYKTLEAAMREADAKAAPEVGRLTTQLNSEVLPRIAALSLPVKVARSEAAAITYRLEHARAHGHADEARHYTAELAALKARKSDVLLPGASAPEAWGFEQMVSEFNRLKSLQGDIQSQTARVRREADGARATFMGWRDAHLRTASPAAVQALLDGLDSFEHDIKQIHIKVDDGELIERCESCHVGILSPVPLEASELGGRKVFTSHPAKELLALHPPEQFGCSPCHGGNGIATESVSMAHGKNKHWLWPMLASENTEAGCMQCHKNDLWMEHASTLNEGKRLFQWRGCVGCHRYEGIGREVEELKLAEKAVVTARKDQAAVEIAIAREVEITEDSAASAEAVDAAYRAATRLRQDLHLTRTREQQLVQDLASLDLEVKKIGPNLKEASSKLKPEWLLAWLKDPRAFRPTTKMPRFRIDDEQVRDIAAFLWQSSTPKAIQAPSVEGDAERGQELVISRGCLACHKVTTDEFDAIGNEFSAELSRMGEKTSAAYIASWVKNPRYHNRYTVMPSLRLSDEDCGNIATWLASLKSDKAVYLSTADALALLTDKSRLERGKKLVEHLGCAACHEIQGLENEGRIGTELSEEGSKPIERLDFGTRTKEYKAEHTYNHKGFFEHKLESPSTYDKDKEFSRWVDRLRMPEFFPLPGQSGYEELKGEIKGDIDALTTFLLGSTEAHIPASLQYMPEGAKQDIQQGWWVIKKYNCDGCHQVLPGATPVLWTLPIYEETASFTGVPGKNGRPPTLVGEGSRVDPVWLSRFLANPALAAEGTAAHERNGVRQGMTVRMPTFFLSERERGTLVRFFQALSDLSTTDYVRPDPAPLEGAELDLARAAFTAGDCANCHLLGGEASVNPDTTYAPSFEVVRERIRPGWTHRWVTEPNTVIPGTAMPAILQHADGANGVRWIVNTAKISATAKRRVGDARLKQLADYTGDHAELLLRYFAQWTAAESAFQQDARNK